MEGYDVITFDDKKVGTVSGESGDYLIVEHGVVMKSKHALPRELAHIEDDEKLVRITVGKDLFLDSPEVDGEIDEAAVRDYYGLAPSEGPGTEGYGESVHGDPARSSQEQALRDGVEPAEQQRARIQSGEPELEESPGMLGDRLAGAEEKRREET